MQCGQTCTSQLWKQAIFPEWPLKGMPGWAGEATSCLKALGQHGALLAMVNPSLEISQDIVEMSGHEMWPQRLEMGSGDRECVQGGMSTAGSSRTGGSGTGSVLQHQLLIYLLFIYLCAAGVPT